MPARADLEQKLGAQIPLDLTFTDETGHAAPLRKFFGEALSSCKWVITIAG